MAKGRIILKTLATSRKIISAIELRPEFEEFIPLLYTMINTHTDDYGHFDADPLVVKCRALPLSSRSKKDFQDAIDIMEKVGLIEKYNGGDYLEIVNFNEVQTFRTDRAKQKSYPYKVEPNQSHTDGMPVTYQGTAEVKLSEVKVSKKEPIVKPDGLDAPDAKPSKPDIKPCPHTEIINLYHKLLPELPRISTRVVNGKECYYWTGSRETWLRSRWYESERRQSLEWWADFFDHVSRSDFLMGRKVGKDGRTFQASLDWLVRPQNFTKVIEGKYF